MIGTQSDFLALAHYVSSLLLLDSLLSIFYTINVYQIKPNQILKNNQSSIYG